MKGKDARRRVPAARTRILGWYIALLTVALVGALFLQRAFLLAQASAEIDDQLDQEVAELRQLAGGINPETGDPFGPDTAAIFDLFLGRNVALEGEAVITLVDGRLYKTDISGAALVTAPLVREWAALRGTDRREVDVDTRRVRYLAVPLIYNDEALGTFIVTSDVSMRLDRVNSAVRIGAIVYGSILVLASALAWVAAGAILRPLRDLNEAARSITESDLSGRIPVEGNDELAEMSRTFNSMLDRLEQAFSIQRRFIDDAGHELRTPITIIRGNLELIGDDPDEQAATMRLVTDELDRMARIVDDLLVLAKSDQPDFVQVHPLDLAELTHELATKAAALGDRGWAVEEAADVVLVADRQRLTQAMMNLIRNAIEHTPPEVLVTLGSRLSDATARIWVSDRGPGIPAEDRGKLFDRFARGQGGRRATGGAGLGLAIVKTIAEAHGGGVEVDSMIGLGTTFTLVIPLQQAPTIKIET